MLLAKIKLKSKNLKFAIISYILEKHIFCVRGPIVLCDLANSELAVQDLAKHVKFIFEKAELTGSIKEVPQEW